MSKYTIRVTKDYIGFCSAHFIVFHGNECERLHGHNYRVGAELDGTLDEDFLVLDFIEVKQILKAITDELDHRMLVPLRSPKLRVETGERAVRIAYEEKEWVFPRDDCVLVPVENTTAELLAAYVAGRLREELERRGMPLGGGRIDRLRIELQETPGQTAIFEIAAGED